MSPPFQPPMNRTRYSFSFKLRFLSVERFNMEKESVRPSVRWKNGWWQWPRGWYRRRGCVGWKTPDESLQTALSTVEEWPIPLEEKPRKKEENRRGGRGGRNSCKETGMLYVTGQGEWPRNDADHQFLALLSGKLGRKAIPHCFC